MVRLAAVLSVLVLALVASATAFAQPPSPAHPVGHTRGVVPSHNEAGRFKSGGSNLSYHGGPVIRTNQTFAIYWVPPGYSTSANYEPTIDGFLGNVAAASGLNSNVYFSDTQ